MMDILPDLERWFDAGERVALATVVETWGSSPRGVGAGITADGRMAGSVSGGCVEGAVVEVGLEVLRTGEPQLLHFGVADETAWEVGLACGGEIDVFVQPLDADDFDSLRTVSEQGRPGIALTVIGGRGAPVGRSGFWLNGEWAGDGDFLEDHPAAAGWVEALIEKPVSRRLQTPDMEIELFASVFQPRPRLVIIGGVHISIALSKIGQLLGYRTIVVDPRSAFGRRERFADADQLIQAWPDEALAGLEIDRSTAVAILTHDPKLDDPALMAALRSPAFYVGALGSRKTQAKRRARLLENGLTEAELDRLHGPIGLDIGASTPEEIALAVMGEIVAANRQAAQRD